VPPPSQVLAPTEAPFGVVIAATSDHLHWVRGACASVRYFVGETPIALLLDGEGSVADLRRTYGVHVVRQSALEHPGLRALKGSTKAKLAALWVSPFSRFLYLDADAVLWGDVGRLADLERFDFVLDAPYGVRRSRLGVMDVEAASRHFPEFDAVRHEADYVNTGAFFAQRDALDLDRYLELVRFSQRHPGVFFNDQGIFNFLVFSAADEGTLRVDQRRLQVKVGEGDATHDSLVRQFRFTDGRPSVTGEPVVIHWVGTLKPTMQDGQGDFFEPMAFFRRQYRLARHDRPEPNALDDLWLRFEDVSCGDWRGENLRGRLRRRRRRAMTQFRFLVGRAKIAARARLPSRLVTTLKKRLSS
jgi:hypothetical protein